MSDRSVLHEGSTSEVLDSSHRGISCGQFVGHQAVQAWPVQSHVLAPGESVCATVKCSVLETVVPASWMLTSVLCKKAIAFFRVGSVTCCRVAKNYKVACCTLLMLSPFGCQAGGTRYVLRKKPPGQVLSSAHAVEREFQVSLQCTCSISCCQYNL